ncbi:MAG: inositol monophosphatase, partial [Bacteroidetes bacterium]|nr:inositol monophosphatase [Bacteroidota bacterium]
MDLKFICEEVCTLTRETGTFIKNEIKSLKIEDIETKGLHDFVTYVDKNSEKKIILKLQEILPEAGYIAEEKTITKRGEIYNWIVDPLDGTTNFIHGIPCYSISIALMKENKIILGVVYEINLDECFYACEGSSAFLNGEIIKVSVIDKVEGALLATGFPYHDYVYLDKFMELFVYFLKNSHGLRRFGSAAVDLVYVACGRLEGFFEYGLNPWDVAAGSFIVQQAGGKVYDFNGNDDYLFGKQIVASNNALSDELEEIIKSVYS